MGKLLCKKYEIDNLLKCKKFNTINLNIQPNELCPLSNGYLIATNQENNKYLTLYDENLSLVLTLDKINESSIQTLFITTNNIDRIYINDYITHSILMTDNELKLLKSIDSLNNIQFKYPSGVEYSNKKLFICDLYNKFIHKVDESLEHIQSYELDYSPLQIKISCDTTACVKPYTEQVIYFYELDTFLLKSKYVGHCGTISVLQTLFYEYSFRDNHLYCFNKYGELDENKKVELCHLKELLNDKTDGSLILFDKKIIISSISKKKLILMENYD